MVNSPLKRPKFHGTRFLPVLSLGFNSSCRGRNKPSYLYIRPLMRLYMTPCMAIRGLHLIKNWSRKCSKKSGVPTHGKVSKHLDIENLPTSTQIKSWHVKHTLKKSLKIEFVGSCNCCSTQTWCHRQHWCICKRTWVYVSIHWHVTKHIYIYKCESKIKICHDIPKYKYTKWYNITVLYTRQNDLNKQKK